MRINMQKLYTENECFSAVFHPFDLHLFFHAGASVALIWSVTMLGWRR